MSDTQRKLDEIAFAAAGGFRMAVDPRVEAAVNTVEEAIGRALANMDLGHCTVAALAERAGRAAREHLASRPWTDEEIDAAGDAFSGRIGNYSHTLDIEAALNAARDIAWNRTDG